MMKTMRFVLAGLALCGAVFAAGAADAQSRQSGQRLSFANFPRGPLASQVQDAWVQDERYAQFVKEMGGFIPDFSMATHDINGDGRPEVFARHTDDVAGWCFTPELEDNLCLMVVYANTPNGLIKIAEIPVGDEVVVGNRVNNGVRDLHIILPNKTRRTYVWNGRAYEVQ